MCNDMGQKLGVMIEVIYLEDLQNPRFANN
jgi:hypothetical protein